MKPLSIAFIGQKGLPARWGGVEAHVDAIATRLVARGHRVTAYVRRWYSGDVTDHAGVALRPLPTLHTKHLDAALHSAFAALDSAVRRADVVHFHALGPSLFCWMPRLARHKIVVTLHALDYRQAKWGHFARTALRAGEELALRVSDEVLVVSRELAAHYEERGRRVTFLPNGVEPARSAPPQRIRALGLHGDDYVLFIGRWIAERQLVDVIETWRGAGPWPWKLVVAGDDPEGGLHGRAVRSAAAGAADVLFPGMVEGALKAELLANATAVLSPSRHEGLPIALLEAMSYARPIVASDISAHLEVLSGTDAALLFSAARPAELADALRRLAALSPQERRERGARGRAHVEAHYSWDAVVDRLEEVYTRVTAGARRHPNA